MKICSKKRKLSLIRRSSMLLRISKTITRKRTNSSRKRPFDVSNSAVKDEKKYFKHVLKLDKNFHVYIHGQKKLVERMISDRDMNYYKLYFREEN